MTIAHDTESPAAGPSDFLGGSLEKPILVYGDGREKSSGERMLGGSSPRRYNSNGTGKRRRQLTKNGVPRLTLTPGSSVSTRRVRVDGALQELDGPAAELLQRSTFRV